MHSIFGSFEKVLLSGIDAGSLLQKAKVPELLFVLHSMQVRHPMWLSVGDGCGHFCMQCPKVYSQKPTEFINVCTHPLYVAPQCYLQAMHACRGRPQRHASCWGGCLRGSSWHRGWQWWRSGRWWCTLPFATLWLRDLGPYWGTLGSWTLEVWPHECV